MMIFMIMVVVNQEGAFMNVNIIGNKVFVNGSPLPPVPGTKSSVSLSQVGNRLYVNGYEYRNGRWKRTLRAILHALF